MTSYTISITELTEEQAQKLQSEEARINDFLMNLSNMAEGKKFNTALVCQCVSDWTKAVRNFAGMAKDKAVAALQAAWSWVRYIADIIWDAIQAFWSWMRTKSTAVFASLRVRIENLKKPATSDTPVAAAA